MILLNSDTARKWHVATCIATQQMTPVHLKFKMYAPSTYHCHITMVHSQLTWTQ